MNIIRVPTKPSKDGETASYWSNTVNFSEEAYWPVSGPVTD
jgi:hypothetical protein